MRLAHLTLLFCIAVLSGCASFSADRYPVLRLDRVHPFGATALAYNANGSMLATGGFHGELSIWRMPDGKQLHGLPGNSDAVRGLVWVDDDTVIGAGADGMITAWDLRRERPLRHVASSALTAMVAIKASRSLVTGHKNGHVRVYAYDDLRMLADRDLGSKVLALAVERNGVRLAASTDDGRVLLLDAQLHIVRELARPPRNALSLRFSPDGRQLAAGAWFEMMLWDLDSGRLSVRDTEHPGEIISLDYTPDGKRIVSLGRITDSSLRVVDAASGAVESRLAPLPLCGWMLQVSPDGRYVAAGSEGGSVHVFDLTRPPLIGGVSSGE